MPNENPHIANSLLNSFKAFVGSHFLLNIINAIQSDVILNNNKSAFDVLQRFNRLYKLAIRNSNDQFIPLEQEISFINEYIGLEQIRFPQNKFPKIAVKPLASDTAVPSFIFQSLVENAWLLSLEHSNKKPTIRIQTNETKSTLIINVASPVHIHPKVENKVSLALKRLDLLKENNLLDFDLTWSNVPFMTLTTHPK